MKHLDFDEEYYGGLDYPHNEQLIRRHYLEVLRWGSKVSQINLLDGKHKAALDVGCAFGYGVKLLASLGYDAVGIDVSTYALRQAKERLRKNIFVGCDIQKSVPIRKRFQLITCFEVLEHLHKPLEALRNMYAACGSVIVCTTPNKPIERIVKKIKKDFDRTHVNVKTPKEWEMQIKAVLGCDSVETQCFVDLNFRIAGRFFYGLLRLPLGMDTLILVRR